MREARPFTVFQKSGAQAAFNTEEIAIETRAGKGQPYALSQSAITWRTCSWAETSFNERSVRRGFAAGGFVCAQISLAEYVEACYHSYSSMRAGM